MPNFSHSPKWPQWLWPVLAGVLGLSAPLHAGCTLEPVSATAPEVSTVAGALRLEGADHDADNPSWLGPIRAGSCVIDSDLFRGPLALANSRYLLVVNYSGSTQWLTAFDLQRCREHWRSPVLHGSVSWQADGYHIRPGNASRRDVPWVADPHCRLRPQSAELQ
ncbi:hypothetical protein [Chitinilyticum litopenaei]|uniref:hypothetical protein n=1 Tax=Chitinilyticum litopenaei TaxID=1121276 RepID=UPI001184F4E6|nr:hypothetical protein [Chitinilyticum litopenaei]